MSRKRAGHGWTVMQVGKKRIDIFQTVDGHWITTGEAQGWRRCTRCRRPYEVTLQGETVCSTCYYYHSPNAEAFWDRKADYLFPYNIGHRGHFMYGDPLRQFWRLPAGANWRRIMREAQAHIPRTQGDLPLSPPTPSDKP